MLLTGWRLLQTAHPCYVSNALSNNVSVIDTFTNTVVTTVAVENDPRPLAIYRRFAPVLRPTQRQQLLLHQLLLLRLPRRHATVTPRDSHTPRDANSACTPTPTVTPQLRDSNPKLRRRRSIQDLHHTEASSDATASPNTPRA